MDDLRKYGTSEGAHKAWDIRRQGMIHSDRNRSKAIDLAMRIGDKYNSEINGLTKQLGLTQQFGDADGFLRAMDAHPNSIPPMKVPLTMETARISGRLAGLHEGHPGEFLKPISGNKPATPHVIPPHLQNRVSELEAFANQMDAQGSPIEAEHFRARAMALHEIATQPPILVRTFHQKMPRATARIAKAEILDGSDVKIIYSPDLSTAPLPKADTLEKSVAGELPFEMQVSFLPMEKQAEEKGIVYGLAYAPYVVDTQGEWATPEDIEEAAHNWMEKYREIKKNHEGDATSNMVVESYIAPCDFALGSRMIRKGSWVLGIKLNDEDRELVKAGKIGGLSMGGYKSLVDD